MTSRILSDTSPTGLRAALEADIVATRLSNVDVPIVAHDEPDASWAVAPDPESLRSVVVRTRFAAAAADRRIDEILAATDAAGTATIWWVAPQDRPVDLVERLVQRGFTSMGDTAAMALDMERLDTAPDDPPGFVIEPVVDTAGVRDFVAVTMTERPEGAPPFARGAAELRIQHIETRTRLDPVPMRFVGRVDSKPVATSRLSVVGGVAGLYAIVTVPAARGRGFGRAMTLAALDAGKRLGLRIATLQATELGLPIYRRIGFEELFRYELLLRPARGQA